VCACIDDTGGSLFVWLQFGLHSVCVLFCTLGLLNSVQSDNKSSQRWTKRRKVNCDVLRWDKGDLCLYYEYTGQLLQSLSVPYHLLTCECEMQSCAHVADINNFYNQLVVLNCCATHAIPVTQCNSSKPYWSGELQQLKEDSMQANKAWLACGKPRQGWLNRLRLHTKYKYKAAIRHAAHAFEWDLDDELSQVYLRKDMEKFWKKMATAVFQKECCTFTCGSLYRLSRHCRTL